MDIDRFYLSLIRPQVINGFIAKKIAITQSACAPGKLATACIVPSFYSGLFVVVNCETDNGITLAAFRLMRLLVPMFSCEDIGLRR